MDKDELKIIVGKRLKELIVESGVNQSGVAESSGVGNNNLSRYINAQQLATLDMLTMLANYFNVSLDYLAGRTDARNTLDNLPPNYTKLSEDEQVLLDRYRRLGPEGKESVRSRALDNLRFEAASRESVAE